MDDAAARRLIRTATVSDEPEHVLRPAGIDPVVALAAVLERGAGADERCSVSPRARSRSASRSPTPPLVREDQPACRCPAASPSPTRGWGCHW